MLQVMPPVSACLCSDGTLFRGLMPERVLPENPVFVRDDPARDLSSVFFYKIIFAVGQKNFCLGNVLQSFNQIAVQSKNFSVQLRQFNHDKNLFLTRPPLVGRPIPQKGYFMFTRV